MFSVLHHCVAPWSPSLNPLIVVLDVAEDRDVIGDLSRLDGGVAGTAATIRDNIYIYQNVFTKNTQKQTNEPKYPSHNCIKISPKCIKIKYHIFQIFKIHF